MSTVFKINNHSGYGPVEIQPNDWTNSEGINRKLVTIVQRHGSLSFQHSMTTDQARAMSDALLACCAELEGAPA